MQYITRNRLLFIFIYLNSYVKLISCTPLVNFDTVHLATQPGQADYYIFADADTSHVDPKDELKRTHRSLWKKLLKDSGLDGLFADCGNCNKPYYGTSDGGMGGYDYFGQQQGYNAPFQPLKPFAGLKPFKPWKGLFDHFGGGLGGYGNNYGGGYSNFGGYSYPVGGGGGIGGGGIGGGGIGGGGIGGGGIGGGGGTGGVLGGDGFDYNGPSNNKGINFGGFESNYNNNDGGSDYTNNYNNEHKNDYSSGSSDENNNDGYTKYTQKQNYGGPEKYPTPDKYTSNKNTETPKHENGPTNNKYNSKPSSNNYSEAKSESKPAAPTYESLTDSAVNDKPETPNYTAPSVTTSTDYNHPPTSDTKSYATQAAAGETKANDENYTEEKGQVYAKQDSLSTYDHNKTPPQIVYQPIIYVSPQYQPYKGNGIYTVPHSKTQESAESSEEVKSHGSYPTATYGDVVDPKFENKQVQYETAQKATPPLCQDQLPVQPAYSYTPTITPVETPCTPSYPTIPASSYNSMPDNSYGTNYHTATPNHLTTVSAVYTIITPPTGTASKYEGHSGHAQTNYNRPEVRPTAAYGILTSYKEPAEVAKPAYAMQTHCSEPAALQKPFYQQTPPHHRAPPYTAAPLKMSFADQPYRECPELFTEYQLQLTGYGQQPRFY